MEPIKTSMPFDPFAMPFGFSDPTFTSEYSPISLFSPVEGFSQDFASESAGSPVSPVSPGLSTSSYGFPTAEDWSSWEPIEQSPGPDGFILPEGFGGSFATKAPLTPAINPKELAMPQRPRRPQPATEARRPSVPTLPSSTERDDASKRYSMRTLKRKSSTLESEESASAKRVSLSPPPEHAAHPKKTAHNMIEKRYRTNLNGKITELRDAIPSLRATRRQAIGSEGEGFVDDDVNNLAPAPKLNKATILSKATDYINQLESKNRNLETENSALRGRMEGLEMLLMAQTSQPVWN
ncbi:helix-loop-helix DNA-binding domain-containing protein [Immersiella caudata]|uniref:Helix-loop-helix DNA-binding domain-containing protein n=1 Tax=Immersiella caudata TaxID=314043 RepID=A0AA39XGW3_9PEZI|nr:helix-loop-helix DNA-binding domain-containing protein [Immersiella caudata]